MGGVVSTLKSIVKGPQKPKALALPAPVAAPVTPVAPTPPATTDDTVQKAAEEAKKKNANRKGRSSTILTGLLDDSDTANLANTNAPLLGR